MKMTTFQIVVTGIFAALILVGVGVFATRSNIDGGNSVGVVTIWGTMDAGTMEKMLTAVRQSDKASFDKVTYVQKDSATYSTDLINAMASGNGPDLFLVSQDQVTAFSDKISVIPYSAISQQAFTDAYIEEGRLFLTPAGTLALPLTIDPLVLYWNRDLLANGGVANVPTFWNDFLDVAPRLTVLDASSNITTSAVALGEWSNILYAKDILATLILQAGDPIVSRNDAGVPTPVLGDTPTGAQENPASSALQFYTEFANPSKTIYSWNNALPSSQDDFVANSLAMYFGFASDYQTISQRNPNLHFSVALVPQIQGGALKSTFGEMTGVAISRTSPNQNGALAIAEKLTSQAGISALAANSTLPPVRRDVVLDTSSNAAESVFAQSALIARGWLDPSPSATNSTFSDMINSVVSGQNDPTTAVFDAQQSLETLLGTNTIQSNQ
jgi:ABC-type glycerol-3-phosphate transport system substrate-binding protein